MNDYSLLFFYYHEKCLSMKTQTSMQEQTFVKIIKKKSRCIHLVEPWISFATCKSVWGFFKIMKKKPPYDPDTRFLDIGKKD